VAGLVADTAELTGNFTMVGGPAKVDLGFLQGYLNAGTGYGHVPGAPARSTAKISWTISTPSQSVCIELKSQRGGIARKEVYLG